MLEDLDISILINCMVKTTTTQNPFVEQIICFEKSKTCLS